MPLFFREKEKGKKEKKKTWQITPRLCSSSKKKFLSSVLFLFFFPAKRGENTGSRFSPT